jgi:type IX secretion system PorP/SprF family membrane protein
MKKIKLIVTLFTVFFITELFAQQDPQYTQYMYNMIVINPAYAGSRGVPTVGVLGRRQWVGVDGAPSTGTFSLSSPIGDAVGLGFSAIYDEIGPVKETNLYVDYSYTIFTGDLSRLAFGLKAGVTFLNVGLLDLIEPDDPLNIPVDQKSPNIGVGIFYYTDHYYLGLSAPNILKTRHLERGDGIVSTASESMHIFLTAGYVFELGYNTKLKPSTMIKANQSSPISVDLSLNALFFDQLEVGASYRLDDSVSGMIGFQINPDLRIGYGYDYTFTNFGNFNSGSHEIILLYEFNRRRLKSPRFF